MISTLAAGYEVASPNSKQLGAYYTPRDVVRSLSSWVSAGVGKGRILDPSCGDGRFLEGLRNAVGVEIDPIASSAAAQRTDAIIVREDFFSWVRDTDQRFVGVVGNPPFIRYQRFTGDVRKRALSYCRTLGVELSGLCSSWAPFVVGAASLLDKGGRLGLVVPAEIGHAVYAKPVVRFLLSSFERVEIIAVREKLFPELSEDCWLLRASGFGAPGETAYFAKLESFVSEDEAWEFEAVSIAEIKRWNYRLRPLLVDPAIRETYLTLGEEAGTVRLGAAARIGIGYVTGANDFFHLRPSEAERLDVPTDLLRVCVRSNRDLTVSDIDESVVSSWLAEDRPVLLLDLNGIDDLPASVLDYLDSSAGKAAQKAYKCRSRQPWFRVPNVSVPDAFLSIMAGRTPRLVGNSAGAVCTNSVHAVTLIDGVEVDRLIECWDGLLTTLSCELEGHALGGGVLKIEPAEAREILLAADCDLSASQADLLARGAQEFRRWRNVDAA